MIRIAVVAAIALLLAPAAGAARYSFGRSSGNIVPFTITIAPSGAVGVTGPVKVGRTTLTTTQLAALGTLLAKQKLSGLPATTLCPGTLPDIASLFVRLGTRTVLVHGSCSARFTRAWNALAAAVRLSYG